jgi:hypothetical protein
MSTEDSRKSMRLKPQQAQALNYGGSLVQRVDAIHETQAQMAVTLTRIVSAIEGDTAVGQRGLVRRVYEAELELIAIKKDMIGHVPHDSLLARVEELEHTEPPKGEFDDVKKRLGLHDKLIWMVGGGAVVVGFIIRELFTMIEAGIHH